MPSPARIAVLDSDSGFVQVLTKRLEAAGWQYRVLASPVPLDVLISMRLNALVVDPAVLGPAAWSYLEKLCARLPQLGVVVCTGQSTVAQRVRGLRLGADDWVTKPWQRRTIQPHWISQYFVPAYAPEAHHVRRHCDCFDRRRRRSLRAERDRD